MMFCDTDSCGPKIMIYMVQTGTIFFKYLNYLVAEPHIA